MKFNISKRIFDLFPNAQFGILIIKNTSNQTELPQLKNLINSEVSRLKARFVDMDADQIDQVRMWRDAFDKLGLDKEFLPSHESLLKRALGKGDIPSINPIVDIYNLISLKYLIPVGGHDIDKVGDIELGETTGTEIFQTMNTVETENVNAGEIAYMSEGKIMTRNFVWRQSEFSKIDDSSKNLFVPIDDIYSNFSEFELRKIAKVIGSYITQNLGGECYFEILDKSKTSLTSDDIEKLEIKKNISFDLINQPNVITDEKVIDDLLNRGISEVLPSKEAFKQLLMSGKRIKIYQGYDPTADKLHIGNAIGMKMLEKFRKLGHHVIFLIGDGTGKIGDPTDKAATRKILSDDDIQNNLKGWIAQARQVLDFENEENPVEVVMNGEWLLKMNLKKFLQLGNIITVQQLLERDMFQARIKENKPITISEMIYPMLQGFDSVMLEVDAEFGGNDQLFNMMTGRVLEKHFLHKEKFVITGKLLTDNSGVKMGKSLGNVINLTDESKDIFGKVMSFSDGMIVNGLEILASISIEQVREIEEKLKNGANPIEFKKLLAFEVTKWIKGEVEAQKAMDYFQKTIQNNEVPEDIVEIKFSGISEIEISITDLIEKLGISGISDSRSNIKRLIQQNGVEVNGEKMNDLNFVLNQQKLPLKLKVGKRNWFSII